MHTLSWFAGIAFLSFAGCNSMALSDGTDAAVPDMAARDMPSSCSAIASQVGQWFTEHTGCQRDSDCQVIFARQCVAAANKLDVAFCEHGSAANLDDETQLDTLMNQWVAGQCSNCTCDQPASAGVCIHGTCGLARSGLGSVGGPCSTVCGRTCLAAGDAGVCTMPCDPKMGCLAGSPAEFGNQCLPFGDMGAFCLKPCAGTADCYFGQVCCALGGASACMPAALCP